MNPQERNRLIDALIEGELSEADFLRLEAELSVDPLVRQAYYERLTLSSLLEIEAGSPDSDESKVVVTPWAMAWRTPSVMALAAILVILLSWGGIFLNAHKDQQISSTPNEEQATGFAVITEQADTEWKNREALANGALLPSGKLHLTSGIAQIELFSGVTVVVEGEAEFEIISPMEMAITQGKMRVRVPEPAHGFRIRTADGEVVDLGTEFAMNVTKENSEVHVLEGEVEWHPRRQAGRRMEQGEAVRWSADGQGAILTVNATGFVGMAELVEKTISLRQARSEDWQEFSESMRMDPRLVAYYRMNTSDNWTRRLPNQAMAGVEEVQEGAVVAAARATDRWGNLGGALDFSPTGSRVRLVLPGEYQSLTLVCWVKINSLDRWYNSLFLTDGHEQHEPHWQIMDDGRLFFSVKKRDTWNVNRGEKDKHIFFSPPFWNTSLSGQWLMIATVYDFDSRRVSHYLNGKQLSQESVPEEYLVDKVSIGAASLGNWGQPEREDPHFAVRNLNGSMDEFALFSEALTSMEIKDIYEHGKP